MKKSQKSNTNLPQRRMFLETLEDRRLLAGVPQLAGIQTNNGDLLSGGDVLHVAPQEIVLNFNQDAEINPASFFAVNSAGAATATITIIDQAELNPGDKVTLRATSAPSTDIDFTVATDGSGWDPGVSNGAAAIALANLIDADANFTASANHADDSAVVTITQSTAGAAGNTVVDLTDSGIAGMSKLDFTGGADGSRDFGSSASSVTILSSGGDGDFQRASATSFFGTGGVVNVEFKALAGGVVGNDIEIVVSKSDHNNASGPTIVVDLDGTTVLVDLNTNAGNETTAEFLVDAINDDAAASALIRASLLDGSDGAADITAAAIDYSPILLSGSNDEVIEAGYIGVDESGRQIVFRFREALTDESYQISVRGTGAVALSDLDGSVFLDGEGDFTRNFRLDLGPQIEAVVPQPVVRDPALGLQQLKDTIHVYFNEDNLESSLAENPEFYPLIFTNDTVENVDDEVFLPTEVEYKPGSDLVVLTYDSDLDELAGAGDGTFRLRIGAKEYQDNNGLPFAPIQLNLNLIGDAGSSYDTATTIGKTMSVSGDGVAAADGTGFTITDVEDNDTPFEFDGGVILQIPDGSLILDGDNFEIGDGAQNKTFEFDSNSGVALDNIAIVYTGSETAEEMAELVALAIESTDLNDVDSNELSGGEIHLGWNQGLSVDVTNTIGLSQEGNTTLLNAPAQRVQVINRASFNASNVADAISSSINAAGNSKLRASRVGTLDGDARIALVGVKSVTDSTVFNVSVFESLIVQGTIGDDGFDPQEVIPNPGDEDEPGHRDIRVQDHLLVEGAYLTVPVSGFQNGDLIQVTDGLKTSFFEFDSDGSWDTANIQIPFTGSETVDQFSDKIAEVLPQSPYVINATHLGGGVISVLLLDDYYVNGLETGLVVEKAPAALGGVTTLDYSFPLQYGQDPLGNTLLNTITENQKQRAREIFEMYGHAFGLMFVETDAAGLKIVTGDLRAIDQSKIPTSGLELAIAEFDGLEGLAILDQQDFQDEPNDEHRGAWFETASRLIGHLLGLGNTDELAPFTIMGHDVGQDIDLEFNASMETRFPGDHDDTHGQYLYGVRTGDLDLYEIDITETGTLDIETFAERLTDVSLLDTAISVFRDVVKMDANGFGTVSGRELVARNDDYFSEDSKLTIDVTEGIYYIGVSSTGNNSYDPDVEGTGQGGKTQGNYELRLVFSKSADDLPAITDTSGVDLDADGDGTPGGTLNTWFNVTETDGIPVGVESRTLFVDKTATPDGDGSISSPYTNLNTAMAAAATGDIVRVIGNAGADGDAATLQDNEAYELGFHPLNGLDLPDGSSLVVKQGVTLMVDAGVVIKSRRARIARGSDSSLIDLSGGAIQMLGTPRLLDINGNLLTDTNGDSVPGEIYLTSLFDKEIGLHTTAAADLFDPAGGDWGGIDINDRFDSASTDKGEFVDLINHTTIQYGGGLAVVEGNIQVVSPIHLTNARPTITNNTLQFNADSAISANPDSFEESPFSSRLIDTTGDGKGDKREILVSDYDRVGPEIHGNTILENSINGLLVRVKTQAGDYLEPIGVATRFDDLDIVHVVTENLIISARVGGPLEVGTDPISGNRILEAKYDASLVIDPGTVVKLHGTHIEMPYSSNLIIEGTDSHQIILTSLGDSRYGAGGTFVTDNQPGNPPVNNNNPVFVSASPGDWSGIAAGPNSALSIDYTTLAFGGGASRVPGTFATNSLLSVIDADARITRSTLEYTDASSTLERPLGSVVYVAGAQPVIMNNVMQHNLGPAISMSVNDLNYEFVQDWGRSTGDVDLIDGRVGNQGPLVQGNMLHDNGINGMVVRGATLTTESVWDDTDITHVVFDRITVPDFHTYGGLRLESGTRESLVVKFSNADAGFYAIGKPLDIDDRIGGSINIVGQPHYPVVLTSISDDTVGAGYTPSGQLQTDAANDSSDIGGGGPTTPTNTEIVVNFGSGIAPGSTLALRVGDAVDLWESVLHDPVSLSLDMNTANLGGNVAGRMFSYASVGVLDYDDVRSAMIADGTTDEKILLNQLPTFSALNTIGGTAADAVYISLANAKALESLNIAGIPFTNAGGSCWTTCDGYFEVDVNFDPTSPGIIQLITHEIGHALGFIGGHFPQNNLSPFDMFRLEPGAGAVNFTTAPRVMDEGRDNVFYDGVYDPAAITAPTGLTVGDIPMSTVTDSYSLSHYKHRGLNGGVYIGVMDPVVNPAPEANGTPMILDADRSVLGLIGWDTETDDGGGDVIEVTPNPGDWDGVNLLQYSNDRNIAVVNERESDDHAQPLYENFDAAKSQYLGQLASSLYLDAANGTRRRDLREVPSRDFGDETLRLGFQIQGTIETPTDQDMYRFEAVSGTEVWLDIDRTEAQLDTIIEMVDSDGRVLYRSDNSGDASAAQTNPNSDSSLTLTTEAQPLSKSVFGVFDNGTTNEKDAGMRVILPGSFGLVNTYHLRVRSADQLIGGSYQLQVRLQELDEEPGSSVQFADIRYATAGVEIVGLPVHSPLTGETAEELGRNNDTLSAAQNIGNLLETDHAVISVAGDLNVTDTDDFDVDFYGFNINYADVQPFKDPFSPVRLVWDDVVFPNLPLAGDNDFGDAPNTYDDPLPASHGIVAGLFMGSGVDAEVGPINRASASGDDNADTDDEDAWIPPRFLLDGLVTDQLVTPVEDVFINGWIDFDGNGAFDADEQIIDDLLSISPVTPFQYLSQGGPLETYARFRFSTQAGLGPNGPAPDGEVEDYKICSYCGAAAIFDLDYADGFARANTSLSIFDAFGNLILIGTDSNIADDRPALPLEVHGIDIDDLSRGSIGSLDPFVGTVELPIGDYSVAVSDANLIPTELMQFYAANVSNPAFRLEPISGVDRLVEERFDANPVIIDDSSLVPYFLGDVVMFVSSDSGFESTSISTVDGFTGQVETTVTPVVTSPGNLAETWDVQDVALHPTDGFMFGFTVDEEDGNPTDAEAGNYLQISTGDGTVMNLDAAGIPPDDGVSTFQDDGTGNIQASDHGIHYDATVFGFPDQGPLRGFVVGHRPDGFTSPVDGNIPPNPLSPLPPNLRNILYRFEPDTGAATSVPEANRQNAGTLQGATTQIVERGVLDTAGGPAALADKLLLADEATIYDVINDITTSRITDGLQFHVDHDGNVMTSNIEFEFNSGPEIYFNMDPTNGLTLRDGDIFNLDAIQTYEFNTGPVLIVTAANGGGIAEQETFTIVDDAGSAKTFEFDTNANGVAGSNEIVVVSNVMTQSQVVNAIVAAINNTSGFNVNASSLSGASPRITLTNDSVLTAPSESSGGLLFNGDHATLSGTAINIEESDTNPEFGANMAAAFASVSSIQMGLDGHRINFVGANLGTFTEPIGRGVFTQQPGDGTVGITPGGVPRVAIPFLAEDTDIDIAARILSRLTGLGIPAIQTDSIVELTGAATVAFAQAPLLVGGNAPGGDITGMAFIGNTLYAVSDNGGFYTIDNPMSNFASANYISNSAADLQGINFQGLAAGPTTTEGGRYANMLFGIDGNGRVYAFDTTGELQPVFVDGTTSIATGIANAHGIDFSPIEENPWNITVARGEETEVGHGVPDSYDGTNVPAAGAASLHFGGGVNPFGTLLNLPGGVHGTVETNEFSLLGYSAADKPTLYFNYFLETEDARGVRDDPNVPDEDMMDSFRVFAADESGEWVMLSTNNSFISSTATVVDELDLDPPPNPPFDEVLVRETFDNTGDWRQARVDLSYFAGVDHIKLRFDFSSAGDTNTGDLLMEEKFTTGSELRVTTPANLRDGDAFAVDGTDFEFDLGFTLVAPTGAAMTDGQTLYVDYGFGVAQELTIDKMSNLTSPNKILVKDDMTAAQVAEAVENAINLNMPRQNVTGILGAVAESNEILIDATNINLNGLSGTYEVTQAVIGDNPALAPDMDFDVDMLKLSALAGTTIRVNTNTAAYGNQLNTVARLFDTNGTQLAISDNDPGPGEFPSTDSYLEFIVPVDGDYFIGISGVGNDVYDPTDITTRIGGSTGRYDLQIDVDIEAGFTQRQNNRVHLPNAIDVINSTALNIEGTPGVGAAVRVKIHSGMTAAQVAARVQEALANTFAGGELAAFKRYDGVIRIIGHTVDNQGPLGLTNTMPGDEYGNFESNRRGQDSSRNLVDSTQLSLFEGVYIDDIIIGFAERGEMASGYAVPPDSSFTANPQPLPSQITTGEYQLELRRGTQHVDYNYSTDGSAFLAKTWDTNVRLSDELAIDVDAGFDIVEGATFTISDGYPHTETTFEFDDNNINDGVFGGHVEIPFDPSSTDEQIALSIRDAINNDLTLLGIEIIDGEEVVVRRPITADFASGHTPPPFESSDDIVNIFGSSVVDVDNDLFIVYEENGDENALREQGQIIIGQSSISHSLGFGVSIASTDRDIFTIPYEQAPRHLDELNTQSTVTGIVVSDNLLTDNVLGGVEMSGDVTGIGAVPFARIVNNSIVGTLVNDLPSGIGIAVSNNSAPTLLNNIISNSDIALDIDASSVVDPNVDPGLPSRTVVGGTVFANNSTDASNATIGIGAFPIVLDVANGDPLFMDSTNGNYYLAPNSLAIDSAIESLEERPDMDRIKSPLQISPSPIVVSDRDQIGQIRVDDPSVPTPAAIGHNIFKDRGALDRADFIGPQAVIVSPLDNNANDHDPNDHDPYDHDPNDTFIEIRNQDLEFIAIQLVESENSRDLNGGSGVLDSSVQSSAVSLFKDGVRLEPRFDYTFEYDSANDIIRLSPLAGKFSMDSTYRVELTGARGIVIQTQTGDLISDGEIFAVDDKVGNSALFEFDSGYSMIVPAAYTLMVPELGGSGIVDGEFFTITSSAGNQVFEFDRDGGVQANAVAVSYTVADDADDVAQSISDALTAAAINLSPHARGDGEVHVGSSAEHTLSSANTVVTQRGVAQSVLDGGYVTVDNGNDFLQIEFDTDGTTLPDTTKIISITPGLDNEQIAERIISAIDQAALGLSPAHVDDGEMHVGGDRLTVLDSSNSSVITFGEPGARSELGLRIPGRAGVPFGLIDGEVFSISEGSTTVTFELDNDATTTAGNRAITFSDTSTLDQIANTIVSQVQLSSLGLTASNLGDGFVELAGSTFQHLIAVGTSGLTQIGFPGVEATVAVNYQPFESFGEEEMAQAIADAINSSSTLEGVTAIKRTDTVLVTGASSVTGILIALTGGIEDRAGNPIYPNRPDDSTTFEIKLTSGLDWGDADSEVEFHFPVLKADDGARHIVVDGFSLGDEVDTEPDGQPTRSFDGDDNSEIDDDDGLKNIEELEDNPLESGAISKLQVQVKGIGPDRGGVLDAWIDFNHDGVWADFIGDHHEDIDPTTGEPVQVDVSEKLVFYSTAEAVPEIGEEPSEDGGNVILENGLNDLYFRVPPQSKDRCPSLRLRLSSEGTPLPTGLAEDGEVEDYHIDYPELHHGAWHNPAIEQDVNKDSFVTPIDALLVINYINENVGPGKLLPNGHLLPRSVNDVGTPPLVDVNDDGFVSSIDAIRVINKINSTNGEGEDEAEGEGEDAWMAYYGVTRVTVTSASIADLIEPVADSVMVDIPVMASPERTREAQFAELDLGRESSLDAVLAEIGGEVSELRDVQDGHDEFFASVQY